MAAAETQYDIIIVAQAEETAHGEETAVTAGTEGGSADGELHTSTEADGGEEHAVTFPPFDATTFASQLLWLALTFGVLYLMMSKLALPRIGEILEVRRDRIEGDLAEADRLRQKTDQAIEAYEAELADARQKAHAIAEERRGEVKAELEKSRAEVEAELGDRMAVAEARIQQTKDEALKNVDDIAAETAAALVSQIGGKVTAKEARAAVNSVVKG
jgi:F-type H+-transporting ATPase subunit b